MKLDKSKSVSLTILIAAALMTSVRTEAGDKPLNPRAQLKQYVEELQGSPDNAELRGKIIDLARGMRTPPPVPDEIDEMLGLATGRFKQAETKADYDNAAKAFAKATLAAPWVGDYYYNLGQALEKAGNPARAIDNFRLYLRAKPKAEDAKEVRVHIGELQAAEETAAAETAADAAKTRERQKAENRLKSLNGGIWKEYWNDAVGDLNTPDAYAVLLEIHGDVVQNIVKDPRYTEEQAKRWKAALQGFSFVVDAADAKRWTNSRKEEGTIDEDGNTITLTLTFDQPVVNGSPLIHAKYKRIR